MSEKQDERWQAPAGTQHGDESPVKDPDWERGLIEQLATDAIREQRRARRWGIFFKSLMFLYLLAILAVYAPVDWEEGTLDTNEEHTAVIKIKGLIASEEESSAYRVNRALRKAFEDDNTKGVILDINSGGGSPVQSGQIYDEIKRLKAENPDMPVYAVVSDICASGAYYIASAADEIYADKASMVGSIGVLMNGFGFVEAIDKLGIERRLLTSGSNKGLLDPFSPQREEEVAHMEGQLKVVHQQFIDAVKQGRGERLKGTDEQLFNGFIWNGAQAQEMGLIDGLADRGYVARELIGAEDLASYTIKKDFLERFAERMGAGAAQVLSSSIGLDTQMR